MNDFKEGHDNLLNLKNLRLARWKWKECYNFSKIMGSNEGIYHIYGWGVSMGTILQLQYDGKIEDVVVRRIKARCQSEGKF